MGQCGPPIVWFSSSAKLCGEDTESGATTEMQPNQTANDKERLYDLITLFHLKLTVHSVTSSYTVSPTGYVFTRRCTVSLVFSNGVRHCKHLK